MRIECVPSDGRPSVMTIVYDGEPWREVHTSIFGRRPTMPQGCLSPEQFQAEFHVLEYALAKKYALKRLSIQAMLSTRLSRSLKERLVSAMAIEKVIAYLQEIGLINDKEWIDSFVRVQTARRIGPRAIAQKLAAKGVRTEVRAFQDADAQRASIDYLLKTRYARRNLKDSKERQKVVASLVRRGFDLSVILKVLTKGQYA